MYLHLAEINFIFQRKIYLNSFLISAQIFINASYITNVINEVSENNDMHKTKGKFKKRWPFIYSKRVDLFHNMKVTSTDTLISVNPMWLNLKNEEF